MAGGAQSHSDETGGRTCAEAFSEFLGAVCSDRVELLAELYPHKTQVNITFDELEQFDEELARRFLVDSDVRQSANEALRYHDLIEGAAYLPNARVVVEKAREVVHVADLKSARKTTLVSVKGKVVDAAETKLLVNKAVYRCCACGSKNIIDARRRGLAEPQTCRECDRKRAEYEFDSDESTYYESKTVELQSVGRRSNMISAPWTATVEFRGDARFEVGVGEWIICTGNLTFELSDGNSVQPSVVAYYAERTQPEDILDEEPPADLFKRSDHELSRQHLIGFVAHTEAMLKQFEDGEGTEEDVKLKIVTPFLEVLEWDPYSGEVQMEYTTDQGGRADYILSIDKEPQVVVEVKGPTTSVSQSKLAQLDKYAQEIGAGLGLLTNGNRYRIIQNPRRADIYNPNIEGHIILDVSYELLPEFLPEVGLIARSSFRE